MESEIVTARVKDIVLQSDRGNTVKFLGFLTPEEAAVCESVLKSSGVGYEFFGGYKAAERTVLCIKPEWCETPEYPIAPLTFLYPKEYSLSHRDFLGALMALGIKRESVGDILTAKGSAAVFVKKEISPFVLSQVSKVGNVGVKISSGLNIPLPQADTKMRFTATVPSLRLDCTVAALCSVSRNRSSELILNGSVLLDSIACYKSTKIITTGQTVTVRGKGKFKIGSTQALSRKGRIILEYYKYV
ncbi:MAG: YlmH/Sll1252 family protein [Clostridia bacterium]|nr:YlmH/Sll1252 family protein [Clostridia bacterium]